MADEKGRLVDGPPKYRKLSILPLWQCRSQPPRGADHEYLMISNRASGDRTVGYHEVFMVSTPRWLAPALPERQNRQLPVFGRAVHKAAFFVGHSSALIVRGPA